MFNTIATPELLASMKPDEVIVATGAIRGMPEIVGKERPHVLSGDDMRQLMLGESSESLALKIGWITRLITRIGVATGLMANLEFVRRASKFWMPLGKHVVIIGGELVGLELGEFLVMRGRKVEVVDEAPRPGAGLTVARRMRLLEELREHGVGINSSVTDIQIGTNDVSFADSQGNRQSRVADHVIIAKGATGNPALADRLAEKGFSVHAIGDCTGVGYIEGAMRGAAKVSDLISR
jgi:NADPH-dependent 2,4-dienoyl-CoA reductase/sulfur reductase-like enzyme